MLDTDVLVVGGGIAGCCTAAKAAEKSLKIILSEKAKTDRSGSSDQGIDHYGIFPREGVTPLELVTRWEHAQSATNGDGHFARGIMRTPRVYLIHG